MRSVINQANAAGIKAVVRQQFEVAAQILAAGLMPIIEPEVDIHCPDKAAAEALLKAAINEKLDTLPADQVVMLKLTLPEQDDFYAEFVRHPKVLKVVALSGGYSRDGSRQTSAQKSRRRREFFAGAGRRFVGPAIRRGVRRHARFVIQNIYEASNHINRRQASGQRQINTNKKGI